MGGAPGTHHPMLYIFRKVLSIELLQLTVFTIFAVKWQKPMSARPTMVHTNPFLDRDPAFGDPKSHVMLIDNISDVISDVKTTRL